MAFRPFLLLLVLVIVTVTSADEARKKTCIKGKYEQSLGTPYTDCYARRRDTDIIRMKMCFTDLMKDNDVVKTSNNQMTVDREEFGKFGRENNNTPVGKAMQDCYNGAPAGDDMYKEAARASQCVFLKLKTGC